MTEKTYLVRQDGIKAHVQMTAAQAAEHFGSDELAAREEVFSFATPDGRFDLTRTEARKTYGPHAREIGADEKLKIKLETVKQWRTPQAGIVAMTESEARSRFGDEVTEFVPNELAKVGGLARLKAETGVEPEVPGVSAEGASLLSEERIG